MRITSSMYYKNLYANENSKLGEKLFDVNKQIASGLKIQYASDDIRTFTETMRLDNEIVVLGQVKNSTQSGFKFSNQSDVILNEFNGSMSRVKTLLIQAANGTNDDISLDAIAHELRGLEDGFKNLANTSINGQYLFSGSAVDTRPISNDGTYVGNDGAMSSYTGSRTQQQYNISGQDLFLGEDASTKRSITTNVTQTLNSPATASSTLSESSTISEFMGDVSAGNTHYFYINGAKSDGSAFRERVPMADGDTMGSLLDKIGTLFGNNIAGNGIDVVNISLNDVGQIVVEDKMKGSSKLDFHIVGATDFSGGGAALVNNIDLLDSGETDYATVVATPGLYIKEFMQSGLNQADSISTTGNNIEGLLYERTEFLSEGNKLSSNVAQILKDTNEFATNTTKLHEVFSGITYNSDGSYQGGLNSKSIELRGIDVNGASYTVDVNLNNGGSSFSVDTDNDGIVDTNYNIFNMGNPRIATPSEEITYKQLMDVVNMAITGNFPTANNEVAYDKAIEDSNLQGNTSLSYDGKIQFYDSAAATTGATLSMYDSNSGDFTPPAPTTMVSFNTNNALTVNDPKTDFFKELNQIITAVENHKLYADSSTGDIRNIGIQNAISKMDDLMNHVTRSHTKVGAQSNALERSLERTSILEISSMSLRSAVIDTDLAEASLTLTQLQLNYQAMLSTVGKVTQLSLVNYL